MSPLKIVTWQQLVCGCGCGCVGAHERTYTFTHIHDHTSHLALLKLHFVQCPIFQKKWCFKFWISFCSQVREWRGICWTGCDWVSQSQSLYILHQTPPLIYALTIITLGGIVLVTSHKQNLIVCAHRHVALWLGLPSDLISS